MEFSRTVDIAAAPTVVWAVMADAERWCEWTASVRSIRLLDKPVRVGSRAMIRQPKFPPAMWTITALDEGRSFTWKTGSPGVWVHAHHSVTPTPEGSRVTLTLKYEGLLGRVIARLTRGITERYLDLEAVGLKRRSEEQVHHQPPG